MREFRSSVCVPALLVAICYLGMAVLSAVCLFGGGAHADASHHHTGYPGKPTHSPLCAWACQAGAAAVLISFNAVPVVFFVPWAAVIATLAYFSQIAWASARPRAPPFASR